MAEENNEVKKPGGGKGLMVVLIALVVILLLAVGVGGYLIFSSGVLNGQQSQQQVQKEESGNTNATYKAAINDLVLNITNAKGREKLMKLSFHLKSTEPSIESIVEEYKPEIVDAVIAQISSRSSEELLTVGGKALLKEELLEDINNIINEVTSSNDDIKRNSVQNILFTTFVIK
ncbi:flagellar basal body-associated FliL family protein [Halarcobacter bivalviorum]|uniref:Flagellar protein FliL n=1 Tax=Halarcobacter bivalviorum TaxID=663364 RepID=A0AAX2AAD7_9BACT|nr:flagellar basal body-associated FliL family protein [Halarcobacter bivalviorum]AXH13352.1 flagellar motor-associated protein FliL [Halarcobacter bivalviorum]RXK10043.1 flagellar basal body protein FliL [Halarcobacter bivalviorum]